MRVTLFTSNSKYIHSSLALRYLQAALQDYDLEVNRLESQVNDDPRAILAELASQPPDVLAVSCYIWNVRPLLSLIRDLKQVLPGLKVILGGPEVGARPLQLLAEEPAVDYVIAGEGEASLPQLLAALRRPEIGPIPGVYGRDPLAANCPARPLPVEDIPLAYADREQLADLAHKLVYVETSRGCPFRCSYCLSAGDPLRFFPLDRVLRELGTLLAAEVPLIKFVDRTFNADTSRTLTIMRFLLQHNRSSRFHFEICADLLTEDLLSFLERVPTGLFQFEIGVQSTDRETLERIGRRTQWDKLAANVRRLRQADNIHLHLDLIAGLPGQTLEQLGRSFDQVIGLAPHQLQLGFLKALPGTPLVADLADGQYIVSASPPYEVLQSRWLSFSELNRLHRLEQLLESYYNSGLLQESLRYLWSPDAHSPVKRGPWQQLLDLTDYWQRRSLQRVNHAPDALFAHFSDWAQPDELLRDLLTIDQARRSPSYPAEWHLPAEWRDQWEQYLNQHLLEFAPRSYKQAFRSLFPVPLGSAALAWYNQPTGQVAVVDRERQRIHGFTQLD